MAQQLLARPGCCNHGRDGAGAELEGHCHGGVGLCAEFKLEGWGVCGPSWKGIAGLVDCSTEVLGSHYRTQNSLQTTMTTLAPLQVPAMAIAACAQLSLAALAEPEDGLSRPGMHCPPTLSTVRQLYRCI
jgi:hypothetical protein